MKKYCMNTDVNVIDHGVNLDKFKASTEKDNSFVVCSQLIERKKIDGILEKFAKYLDQYNATCRLYIIGEGELKSICTCTTGAARQLLPLKSTMSKKII